MNHHTHAPLSGGTTNVVEVTDIDVDGIDDPRRASALAELLDIESAEYERAASLLLEELRAVLDGERVDLPKGANQVPMADYGGREWVVQHEDTVPFEVLATMVLLVEFKTRAMEADNKRTALLDHVESGAEEVQLVADGGSTNDGPGGVDSSD